MMKTLLRTAAVMFFLLSANGAQAGWFWDNNDWECWGPYGKIPGCNPYDEWDPRYWMEEMEDVWDDDDGYYGPYGYGPGPYGPPPVYGPGPGYAPAPYGPPPGYAPPPPPPAYGPGPGYAPPPPPPGYGPGPRPAPGN